jgi:hypothetical protein
MPIVWRPVLDAPPRKPRARDRFYTWPKIGGTAFIRREAVRAWSGGHNCFCTVGVRAARDSGASTLALVNIACPIRDKTCPYNSLKPH